MPFDAAFLSTWDASPEQMFARFRATFSPFDSVIAFLTGATLLWALVVGLFVLVYLRKKRMASDKVRMWELEEELQRERILRVLADRNQHEDAGEDEYIQ